jgi:primosomal protein N' (replication factor Y) (superfamily II helicase)
VGADQPRGRSEGVDLSAGTASAVSGFASVVLVDPALTHFERRFTYMIPDELEIAVGSLVRVPFHGRRRSGVVIDVLERADVERTLPVASVLGPGLDVGAVSLARWVGDRYLSTVGEALAAVLPQRVASEEGAGFEKRTEQNDERGTDLLAGYRDGEVLKRAIVQRRGGGFVVRARLDQSRAGLVCQLAAMGTRAAGVLVLVPETSVQTELTEVLDHMFGNSIAWLGSDRSHRARYRDWLALRSGSKRLAVGGRAAVFAPVQDLALIVIDDEAHASFKEGRAPRFHARTVAAERARRNGATLVLIGSPESIEARAAAENGPYTLVSPSRADERSARASVTVVDAGPLVPAAKTLSLASEELAARRRVVVLAHRSGEELERIAERTDRIVRPRRPARLDAGAGRSELSRAARSADCICATPFIAKDVRLDEVGLLALVDVDAALAQPEYRAAEETFATWWRAARWVTGRKLVIETAEPSHPAIAAMTRWDPDVLWRAEATRRRELGYPPFAALARIDVPMERAAEVASEIASTGVEVLGPVEREGGGAVLVARAPKRDQLLAALGPLASRWRESDEPMRIDVDPWEVLVPKWQS